jgi:hypothetical protein
MRFDVAARATGGGAEASFDVAAPSLGENARACVASVLKRRLGGDADAAAITFPILVQLSWK